VKIKLDENLPDRLVSVLSLYRQKASKNWWIKYYRNGRAFRESSGRTKEKDAKRLLRLREGDIEHGLAVTPQVGRIRFEEAAADVLNDYRTNGKRSIRVAYITGWRVPSEVLTLQWRQRGFLRKDWRRRPDLNRGWRFCRLSGKG
jgi:hypothetical protein